jgi:hypothetical protein
LDVDIELFPMPLPPWSQPDIEEEGPTFDVKKFFANIISMPEEYQSAEM